jgi:CheY-like chemotaxis protein
MPPAYLLLVDDAPEVRTIVAVLCDRAGFRLDACGSVAAAWALLQTTRPDLILLDVQLPQQSGVELCRLVRAADVPLRTTPVALFTHWGVPGDVVAGLEAGADYVVSKDLLSDPARWPGRVSEILAHAAGRREKGVLTYVHGAGDMSLAPPSDWVDVINQAWHRILVRPLGGEVARVVVRRALRQVSDAWPAALQPGAAAWEGTEFPPDWQALARRPEAAALLAAALAEQTGCLVGTEEAASFRAALAPLGVGPEFTRPQR